MRLRIILADTFHNYKREGLIASPMNVGYLSAYASLRFGNDVEIVICNNYEGVIDKVKTLKPHIVALSNYVWNYSLNIALSEKIKAMDKNILLVMGGPNIKKTNEAIESFFCNNPFLDVYVFGQGELPFGELLEYCFKNPKLFQQASKEFHSEILGCAFLDSKRIVYKDNKFDAKGIENLPSPYLTGVLDDFIKEEYWQLFETNRGCPFSCSYCDYPFVAGRSVIQFPIERAMAEFEYVLSRGKSKVWFIVDANFGLLERDVLIAERLRSLLENTGTRIVYFASKSHQERVQEISKILSPMSRTTLIGIQSLNKNVLKAVQRKNIGDKVIRDSIKYCKSEHIPVKIDLIMGLPEADLAVHIDDFRKAFAFEFDHIEGFALRSLPSSEISFPEYRQKYGIKTGYRPVSGLLGIYDGKKIIEYEENVIQTRVLSEKEYHFIRIFYWMIWFGFNMGFLKIFYDLLGRWGKNPADFIEYFLIHGILRYPHLNKMIDDFHKESEKEWFPSLEEADAHYKNEGMFNKLLYGQRRLNTKYFAMLIYDQELREEFMECLKTSSCVFFSDNTKQANEAKRDMADCIALIDKLWVRFQDFEGDYVRQPSQMEFSHNMASIVRTLVDDSTSINKTQEEMISTLIYFEEKNVSRLRNLMEKFGYATNPILAIERIVLTNYGAHLVDNVMQYRIKRLSGKSV